MNIVFESAPEGTTHFLRYASGYIVWCKLDEGQNNQLILSEWDSGNEYWVPGIFTVEHYQKIGLTSIDNLPTQSDVGPDAVAPKDATHRYQHSGETSWYRETEGNLFIWRDGSWYASTQKRASDLAKVCPFGSVTILTQEVQLGGDSEDDLTWLARNVHEWPAGEHQPWCYVGTGYHDEVRVARGTALGMSPAGRVRITRDQWLARRAELQGKPSWSSLQQWAKWIFQNGDGFWYATKNKPSDPDEFYRSRKSDEGRATLISEGEVLGDWRDTLERRPEKPRADLEVELVKAAFDTLTNIEDNQEQKMQQDNGWFERGELPSAGTECEFCNSDDEWTDWHHCVFVGKDAHGVGVISIIGDDAGMLYRSANPKNFRPIRTDREKLTSLINGGMLTLVKPEDIADAIIAAGFKRDGGAA